MSTSLLVALAAVVAAPAPKEDPKKPATLVGEWVVEKVEGVPKDRPMPKGEMGLRFTDDGRFLVKDGTADYKEQGTYKADPTKDPAEFDLIPPAMRKGEPIHGIYRVAGDTLTLCMPRKDGAARPTRFEPADDGSVMVLTLKRAKPKK